jgi:hypothetical protein
MKIKQKYKDALNEEDLHRETISKELTHQPLVGFSSIAFSRYL